MIQTGLKVKQAGKFVKDYLSVIILVPAFIGGIWQLIELASISIPYIRFFSISQIAPDGIIILIFLLLACSGTLFHLFLDFILPAKSNNDDDDDDNAAPMTEADIEKKRKKDIRKWICIFMITYLFGIAYFKWINKYVQDGDVLFTDGAVAIFVCLLCNISLDKCYNLASVTKKEDYKFFNVFLLAFYVMIGVHFCKKIHNSFLLTTNFDNIENVKCVLNEKYRNSKNEILYFNDKYIFINVTDTLKLDKVTKKPIEKIHIMELEKLFND